MDEKYMCKGVKLRESTKTSTATIQFEGNSNIYRIIQYVMCKSSFLRSFWGWVYVYSNNPRSDLSFSYFFFFNTVLRHVFESNFMF